MNKTLVFTTINDTRSCQKGSCSCGTPSCAGQVNLYGANSCSGGGSTVGRGPREGNRGGRDGRELDQSS